MAASDDGLSCLLTFVPGDELAPAPEPGQVLTLAAELGFSTDGARRAARLRLYPLLCDNLRTGYRPTPVGAEDLERARALLGKPGAGAESFAAKARAGQDARGRYLEVDLPDALAPAPAPEPKRGLELIPEPEAEDAAG